MFTAKFYTSGMNTQPAVNELFRLDGQIALVTGGAGLYGKPISRALAQAGATVVVASRSRDTCEAFAAELRGENLESEGELLDMANAASVGALAKRLEERFGGVQILVNNAYARVLDPKTSGTPGEWMESLRANILGIHLCTEAFVAGMIKAGSGSIVNIGSIYGVVGPDFRAYDGQPFSSPPDYAFIKGGLLQYSRYCATKYAKHGIRVNCLSPGGYESGQPRPFQDHYNNRVPLGRMAEDLDIAGPVVFLASEASRYITGANLMLDGGLTAW